MTSLRSIVWCLICGVAATAQAQEHYDHGNHHGNSQGHNSNNGGGWGGGRPYVSTPIFVADNSPYPQVAISGYREPRYQGNRSRGYQSPVFQSPVYQSPVFQSPVYQSPVYQSPVYQSPVYQSPVFVNTGPGYWPPLNPISMAPVISVVPVVEPTPPDPAEDPAKRPAKPSTAAARLRSLEHQANGDEQLRKQLWAQAYMRYRSAIDAAGDRGEARFRQAFTHTVMQHYGPAIREFKRGLFLDRDLPINGIRLAMLFGPGSEALRTSVLHKVADWAKEDPKDADRLFLLGLLLHYEDDPRSREILKAAQRVSTESTDHIVALLTAQDQQPPPAGKPGLLLELPPLPEGGLPQPAVPQLQNPQLPPLNPVAEPIPVGIPVLSNRPTPPVVVVANNKLTRP